MTPVHPPLDAHLRRRISCRSPAVSPLQTSGNSLSHRSELISPAAAPLTTIRTEIVTRRTSIPPNDCPWTSMLQLQAIRLAAEPAIDVIPNGATEEGPATRRQHYDLVLCSSTYWVRCTSFQAGNSLRASMPARGEAGLRFMQVRLTAGHPSILIANQRLGRDGS
jgi:hypothetical protein